MHLQIVDGALHYISNHMLSWHRLEPEIARFQLQLVPSQYQILVYLYRFVCLCMNFYSLASWWKPRFLLWWWWQVPQEDARRSCGCCSHQRWIQQIPTAAGQVRLKLFEWFWKKWTALSTFKTAVSNCCLDLHLFILIRGSAPEEDLKTAVALSGGSTRAMVAAIGALRGMEDLSLISHVDLLVSVSGGTWTAGPYMPLEYA